MAAPPPVVVKVAEHPATAVQPAQGDANTLTRKFNKHWGLLDYPPGCQASMIDGTLEAARDHHDGKYWAIAQFQHGDCNIPTASGNAIPIDGGGIAPYNELPPVGVFTRPIHSAQDAWTVAGDGGLPFPCPHSALDEANGRDHHDAATLPAEVLQAWHLPFALNCDTVLFSNRFNHQCHPYRNTTTYARFPWDCL